MSMEILDNGTTPLSNYEVLTIIRKKQQKWKDAGRESSLPSNVKHITEEVTRELTREGSPLNVDAGGTYNNGCYMELCKRLMKYRLPTGEMLQIFNLRPTTLSELDAIIVENEQRARFQTKYLKDILRHVREVLGEPPAVDGAEEAAEEG